MGSAAPLHSPSGRGGPPPAHGLDSHWHAKQAGLGPGLLVTQEPPSGVGLLPYMVMVNGSELYPLDLGEHKKSQGEERERRAPRGEGLSIKLFWRIILEKTFF